MTVLILSSRGASVTTRYTIKDLCKFVKSVEESKYDIKDNIKTLIDIMDVHECSSLIYFETTKRIEKLWVMDKGDVSIRFVVYSLFTMKDLNFPVNCFKECGHVLMFTKDFDEIEALVHVKRVFSNVFASNDPKDRCLSFFYVDGKIWARNYVILENELQEIGPRMVIEVDKILAGNFSGKVLYSKKVEDARANFEQSLKEEV